MAYETVCGATARNAWESGDLLHDASDVAERGMACVVVASCDTRGVALFLALLRSESRE